MALKRFHRWNAVFLAVFIVLHMANHVAGYWGIATYNTVQETLRFLYRNSVVEPVLLASCVFQIVFGVDLLRRGYARMKRSRWGKIQALSGGIFALFLTQHLLALALARWGDGLNTNFYWPASVMHGAPFTWYFVPYYFLGVSALFTHVGCAIRLAMLRAGRPHLATQAAVASMMLGAVLGAFIVSILLQTYFEITLPAEWVSYLQRFVPSYDA